MERIKLGLDLGTNSIGWAVLIKKDGKYEFLEFEDKEGNAISTKGSYIFPKGVNADENSKAVERRGFRSARKRSQRIILRKIKTLRVLNEYELCPTFEEGELSKWKNKKIYPCENEAFIEWQRTGKKGGNTETERRKQPYYLRHLAATQEGLMNSKNGKLQLGRAFYHLAQRRGYLSNSDEEQTEDKLEQFKIDVRNILEENSDCAAFKEPFEVIFDAAKKDDKVKRLGNKIVRELKKEIVFENLKSFINKEFDKPENLGTVMKAIGALSQEIKSANEKGNCEPTLGSYFNFIYTTSNDKGLINKIRGRYTHRNEHYLEEFNYICKKQNITEDLKKELHFAIFHQRPLKSQKGLVANCPLETKRKRIALSHPLFEEFRMWESINRIKISRNENSKLEFLSVEEKELIKPLFLKVQDFEFRKIASIICNDKWYAYIKEPHKVYLKEEVKAIKGGVAEVFFNFPLDKKFSACPTTARLNTLLGKDEFKKLPFLNTSYKDEKNKQQVSIEDIWHCLFLDDFGKKTKQEGRKDFAIKHLTLDEKGITSFQKIKLAKGYGNLSKAALKKIVPFLKIGEIYSHAVFLANVSDVLGRKLSKSEETTVSEEVKKALKLHKEENKINGIVNNYIAKLKDKDKPEMLGSNSFNQDAHKKSLLDEIINWVTKSVFNKLNEREKNNLIENCWNKFNEVALDKLPKEIRFISTKVIPEFILEILQKSFPNEKIDISKLYHPSAMDKYPQANKRLGNPEIASIKNPVFNRAMHQIKRLCNKLILEGIIDKNTEVNVEVAGEINSASYRRALSLWQKEQETIRAWAKKEIINTYPKECRAEINPTETDVIKYIFWKEQSHQCLYTKKQISICDFLGGKTTYDIEHTIPRSRVNDNSLVNKTLADSEFNRKIKKDILPGLLNVTYKGEEINKETILQNRTANLNSYSFSGKKPNVSVQWNVSLFQLKTNYKKYKNAAKFMSDPTQHSEMMVKVHYTKMKLDYLSAKYKTFEVEEITKQFSNANLVDTRIITKYARAYLNSYFNKVNVVNGKITDTLRKMWGLEGENEQKDRSNHIHHCIDAIVVACVERGTVNWISEAFHKYERDYFKGNQNPRYQLKSPMNNFAERMHNLHKEVFIYHRQIDRIKPLIENLKKENAKKLNLRGKLNSQNPYAHIKKNDALIFVKRELITKFKIKDFKNIVDEGIKRRILTLGSDEYVDNFLKESIKKGYIELPECVNSKGKKISKMIIKKIRLQSSKSNLKDYKEIRLLDKSKFEYKRDYYFDKAKYTNYEAWIFGDLVPDENGKLRGRKSLIINHYDIVKNVFQEENTKPILKLHTDDLFIVFDKNPNEEIDWENVKDLQMRLFSVAKFIENKEKGVIKEIILKRHSYALGNVDKVPKENCIERGAEGIQLSDLDRVVLRRSPSTLKVIPVKQDALGNLDIEYSKSFLNF
mgnify:FL=1|tara:strand:+ start:247 stop:4554 length:4308 start_codon:yes stop_codon:yes gene_type:complete